jgi:hypothetical protein
MMFIIDCLYYKIIEKSALRGLKHYENIDH